MLAKFHQAAEISETDDAAYLEQLQVLEYDLTAGEKSSNENGETPYQPVEMRMGCAPIAISSVSTQYGRVLVNGQNFTDHSVIEIDGASWPTAFVDSAQIVSIVPQGTPMESLTVAQIASDGTVLSRTDAFALGN